MNSAVRQFSTSLAVTLIIGIPIALASRYGADPGHSGGRASVIPGQNCTACHQPFTVGDGGVELTGAPKRYRAGKEYDLTVRVFDAEQAGAGFQISAESDLGHEGTLLITDAVRTQLTDFSGSANYATHQEAGIDDSVANWAANGGSYQYSVRWRAPDGDSGPVTFFAAGNAINNADFFVGDRYYSANKTAHYAIPGDADGDTNKDLSDFQSFQQCFSDDQPYSDSNCGFVDFDDDGTISLEDVDAFTADMTGPVSSDPAGYVLADAVRGGLMYDRWWGAAGLPSPQSDHPLWANRPDQMSNTRTGSTTWRCKECHGWDYKGVDGAYGSGSHRTGFAGVFGTTMTSVELFNLLKSSPSDVPNGHDYAAMGLGDEDIWDIVRFTLTQVIDTSTYISPTGVVLGIPAIGEIGFNETCYSCHGPTGDDIPQDNPHSVGEVALDNPWEFLHKVRFGDPGASMPSYELIGLDLQDAINVAAYARTLVGD